MRQDCQSNKVMSYLTPAHCCVRYPYCLDGEIYQYREGQWKNSRGFLVGQLTLLIQGTSDLRHICLRDVRPVFLELKVFYVELPGMVVIQWTINSRDEFLGHIMFLQDTSQFIHKHLSLYQES